MTSIWALKRPTALEERGITHVLSVLRVTPSESWGRKYRHMVIDVDDVDDEDLLCHLPRAVRFINEALHPEGEEREDRVEKDHIRKGEKARVVGDVVGAAAGGTPANHDNGQDAKQKRDEASSENEEDSLEFQEKAMRLRAAAAENSDIPASLSSHLGPSADDPDAIRPVIDMQNLSLAEPAAPSAPGAVYVHCAMGKSRSVTATAAYLLFKHPSKFGRASHEAVRASSKISTDIRSSKSSAAAVAAAVAHIRRTREIAEPNDGFMRQLEMWWDMGCPVAEGELEAHPIYQKWSYKREVEESLAVGEAPSRLRFEDEERAKVAPTAGSKEQQKGKELKCKKCRRVIATSSFVIDHRPLEQERQKQGRADGSCQHFFVEPLSWMRNMLESGELDGRLACPNERCGASLGRFSWKGFRCSCGSWVTPAFSLAKGRVDESLAPAGGSGGRSGPSTDAERAALGIRMPPGPGRL